MDFLKYNSDFLDFTLEMKELSFHVYLRPWGGISEIKEELYYRLYNEKKEIARYCESRPDFSYALDPIVPDGSEPFVVRDLIKEAKGFGLGPICGQQGHFADLALDALNGLGSEILVACGNSLAMDFQKERFLPIGQSVWGLSIPPRRLGVTMGKYVTVMATKAMISNLSSYNGDCEVENGGICDDVVAGLITNPRIRGGVFFNNGDMVAWGGAVLLNAEKR